MIAKITKPEQYNARRYDNKMTVSESKVCAVKNGEIITVARVEWYMGRSNSASVVYCNLWVPGVCSGSGRAGGYGYHKESAALAQALTSAGIDLYGSPYSTREDAELTPEALERRAYIDGCGSASCDEALKAIARALGFENPVIV